MSQDYARKLFVGPKLKRLRRELGFTQARMADELGVSASYLNLIERNQRPVTAQILIRLANAFDVDARQFSADDDERVVAELEEILADPLLKGIEVGRGELRDVIDAAPAMVDVVRRLYEAHVALRGRPEAASPALADTDRAEGAYVENPVDRVRAVVQDARNHFPEIEEAAERLALELATPGHELFYALRQRLKDRHGIRVSIVPDELMRHDLRRYDRHRRQLRISEFMEPSGRTFQAAYQLAFAEAGEIIERLANALEPEMTDARRLLRIMLANYFAAALMMPYARFHEAAEALGYDIDVLGARFGASFEQVAHRLTTLARPTMRGVPFFLLRVDSAGNVSKRFSSGRFPFSRFGGTCPLWTVHATFKTPGQILTQVVELPDGSRWFSVARTVRRALSPYGVPSPHFALGLGCELKDAHRLTYARGLDLAASEAAPIGINCRLCERAFCPQRAAPPISKSLLVDETVRSVSPFAFV
ncbi:helix-turn-helix domain-containing protein [Salinarimonas soli]|uniref:ImmA/IrrE family metallo-endopeptidase n=1 Tax=Salinarimonas soli TaxID=1638099 RepID=A0A5B2VDG4_9HYPH|nr:helix-turn-helix transcriptional regulator [Salinarimonas soli]KAA2237553.1 ImmA/IrrE family metallo-endopeptidase [Salinarimonas soli]